MVLAAGAYCVLTVAALAVLVRHQEPVYVLFLAGYVVLAGLFLSKLRKGRKSKSRRPTSHARRQLPSRANTPTTPTATGGEVVPSV